jgi:tRNA(adenine34) deaminase
MTTNTGNRLDDAAAMALAIAASRQALAAGNMPFGALLRSADGRVLHVAGNDQVTTGDLTGHAEIALLRQASMRLGREALHGTTVFASGEPCAMCAGALFWAGVRRIVFAASNQDIADYLGGNSLPSRTSAVLAGASPPVAVDGPLMRDEAIEILRLHRPGST